MAATNRQEKVLYEAEFDPQVKPYWLISGTLIMVLCVVTIPLLPVWWIVGLALTERYRQNLGCVLTDRNLKVSKGVFVRVEKTVPLDKITDLGLVQGPIMRRFGLEALSIETAGGTATGALVRLIGVVGTRDFRERVLEQRDRLMRREAEGEAETTPRSSRSGEGDSTEALLRELVATTKRIEEHLAGR